MFPVSGATRRACRCPRRLSSLSFPVSGREAGANLQSTLLPLFHSLPHTPDGGLPVLPGCLEEASDTMWRFREWPVSPTGPRATGWTHLSQPPPHLRNLSPLPRAVTAGTVGPTNDPKRSSCPAPALQVHSVRIGVLAARESIPARLPDRPSCGSGPLTLSGMIEPQQVPPIRKPAESPHGEGQKSRWDLAGQEGCVCVCGGGGLFSPRAGALGLRSEGQRQTHCHLLPR